MKLPISILTVAIAVLGVAALAQAQEATIDDVKAQFAGLSQSEIEALDYVGFTDCVDASELQTSVLENLESPSHDPPTPTAPGQGFHYLNEGLVDTTLDPLQPELILLGPSGEVWGVEYATPPQTEPLRVLGQQLTTSWPAQSIRGIRGVEELDLDVLHLWMIDNPAGQFSDFNPDVTCANALPVTGGTPPVTGGRADWWILVLGGSALAVGGLAFFIWQRQRA